MAQEHAAVVVDFDTAFDLEPPPSTKRLDHRDLAAVVAIMEHIEDPGTTLVASPEESRAILAYAFANPADNDIAEDVTIETKAPLVAIPDWVFAEMDEGGREPRPWPSRAMIAAWSVALTTLALSTYVLSLTPP